MFKAYRVIGGLLLMACAGAAMGMDAVSKPECAGQVCALNVIAKNLIAAPCVGYSVLAVYSTSSGASLIQCSKMGAEADSLIFVYDRLHRDGSAFEYAGGRWFTADVLAHAQTEGIPDKFAARPLCAAKERAAPEAGQLIFLEKRPSGSEDSPYCYRIHYVVTEPGLAVRSDMGEELRAAPEKTVQQWAALRQKLAPYLVAEEAGVADAKKMASVASEKATLYSSPDVAGAGRMYLVKGDQVEIADESKAAAGWYLIHYVTKAGKTLDRWMKAGDLDVAKR